MSDEARENALDTPDATAAPEPVEDERTDEEVAEARAEQIDEREQEAGKHVVADVTPAPPNPDPEGNPTPDPSHPEAHLDEQEDED